MKAPLTLTDYARKHWSFKSIGGRKHFGFDRHEYLRAIYEEEATEIVVQKSAQCGLSEWLVCRSFFLAEVRKATGLLCFPKERQLNDFSRGRIDPAIQFSPHLQAKVQGVDNVGQKDIGGTFLYFRGMQNLDQINSIDADFVMFDEYDRMIQDHVGRARKRVGASFLRHICSISVPSFPQYGINEAFLKSDGREWFIKCDRCGERQCLNMTENVIEATDSEAALYCCRKCRKPIDHTKAGEWVAARPESHVAGFHVSKLMCPTVTPQELLDNSKDKQDHYNYDLGLPYAREGGKLTRDMLDACRREYTLERIAKGAVLGIDVGRKLHYTLGLDGRLIDAGEVDDFEELDRIMKTSDVGFCVIDALPETREAKKFAKRFRGRVWIAFYTSTPVQEPWITKKPKNRKEAPEVHIDRTQSLDATFAAVIDRDLELPEDIETVSDFYDHLSAPIRITKSNKTGNQVAVYEEFGKPDHYAHALNYMNTAQGIKAKRGKGKTLTRIYS